MLIATDFWQRPMHIGMLAGLILSAGSAVAAAAEPPPVTRDDFCMRVQQVFAGTRMVPQNTVYPDEAEFRHSKTEVRPLRTHQYVMPEPGTRGSPMRISCKVKTPDHLNAEYGPGTATDNGLTCRDINRDTVRRVYASLTPDERARLTIAATGIVFDDDLTTFMGSSWIPPYDFAYQGADGKLHLLAKSLRVDWDNLWLSWAPNRLRGAYYCHLVAPEYVRRLALGEARLTPSSAQ